MNKNNYIEYSEVWIPQRADPYVVQHSDGKYYFTASVPAYDRIVLRTADSLSGLAEAEEITIWQMHEKGEMGAHIWAPELHYLNNHWYLYFAAGEKEKIWNIRPYVLECSGQNPVTDSWNELGKMQCADVDEFSFRAFSLDATVFSSQGKNYYVWAEKVSVGKQISNLYIGELEAPNKLKSAQVLLSTPDYDWERKGFWVNEGPAVIKHDNKIYLTYSASDTGINYCIGMLSAEEGADLLDPSVWTKERYPVLESDEQLGIYGPGHNSFTKDENGKDIMVFHARTSKEIVGDPLYNPTRHAMIMPIVWKEGRPHFSFLNGKTIF